MAIDAPGNSIACQLGRVAIAAEVTKDGLFQASGQAVGDDLCGGFIR